MSIESFSPLPLTAWNFSPAASGRGRGWCRNFPRAPARHKLVERRAAAAGIHGRRQRHVLPRALDDKVRRRQKSEIARQCFVPGPA
jgi:hypothetical protein